MSMPDQMRPGADSWVASIHLSADDLTPLGGGVLIDARRVLTCAHLVVNRDNLWVAFPKAENAAADVRRRAERIVLAAERCGVQDLALLILAKPVPPGVAAARLRCPSPGVLVGLRWWAYGFPGGDQLGNSTEGTIGAALAYGWIRLDALSRYQIERGFSGGGLWSPDYQAVIGIVGQANDRGDGRAITLHQAKGCFPGEQLEASWMWTLSDDPEAARHWRPRARGVSIDSEQGYRFRGRTITLQAITSWLDRSQIDRRVLVVTGSPGTGKSAVLGRIVTTADPHELSQLPSSDTAVRASPGSVACAVHAKGKTALEVATEIARAASAALPDRVEDLAPALRAALAGRKDRRFNVIVDSLDEAASAAQTRTIIAKVILPIAETCGDTGLQVVAGSRSGVTKNVLASFGSPVEVIDLDNARFFDKEDLAAYALATLKLAGGERPGSPYADEDIARPIADRIAEIANRNFLVAGLIARAHGLYDQRVVDAARLSFTPGVDMAMREYLQRLPPSAGVAADAVLTALAFAESEGMPVELWQAAIRALGVQTVPAADLMQFARSPAASFLVESSSSEQGSSVFRLFHQALNDALLRARAEAASYRDDERALTETLLAVGRRIDWQDAPVYLLRHLPSHAARAGMIDDLLTDDGYLLHADMSRLMPLIDGAKSDAAQQRARLLRLTPRAFTADPPMRAALFSITETLEGLGNDFTRFGISAPYRALWAAAMPSNEQAVLEGHTDQVQCICAFTLDGRTLLASTSYDRTVRVWDPAVGTEQWVLHGHEGAVNSVCAFTLDGRALLASCGGDRTVRIWDPAAATQLSVLRGHTGWITSICAFSLDGRSLLATGSYDQTVRIWDPATGVEHIAMAGHTDRIESVCMFTLDGQTLLASGSKDQTVRIWDPATGALHPAMYRHTSEVRSVSAFFSDDCPLLAIGGNEQAIGIWNPATGAQHSGTCGHTGWVRSVSAFTLDGRTLIATGGDDHTIRIWDPAAAATQAVLRGHTSGIRFVSPFSFNGRTLIATGGDDHTIRIWDPAAGSGRPSPPGHSSDIRSVSAFTLNNRVLLAGGDGDGRTRIWDIVTGAQLRVRHDQTGSVTAICAFALDQDVLLATVSSDDPSISIWNPATGAQHSVLRGHTHGITSLCAFTHSGRALLFTASYDHTARIWDPATRTQSAALNCTDLVTAACAFTHDGHTLLATGNDQNVRIWDPATGNPRSKRSIMQGHTDRITSLCPFTVEGDSLLASSSNDQTIRIWDLTSGTQQAVLEGHKDRIHALCTLAVGGRALLATGSNDRAIRIWNPATKTTVAEISAHQPVQTISYASGLLLAGTTAGLLAIQLSLEPGRL